MSVLNINWKQTFGTMYYWMASDSKGRIARMMNNNWGSIPFVLLEQNNIEQTLDALSEYLWEESDLYKNYPKNKMGNSILDLYSSYPVLYSRTYMENWVKQNSDYNLALRDENLPAIKGIYIYQALDGNQEGDSYLVDYNETVKIGDYYRYLIPTIYANIYDFPKELWNGIAVSNNLDFSKNQLITGENINFYFTDIASNIFESKI